MQKIFIIFEKINEITGSLEKLGDTKLKFLKKCFKTI